MTKRLAFAALLLSLASTGVAGWSAWRLSDVDARLEACEAAPAAPPSPAPARPRFTASSSSGAVFVTDTATGATWMGSTYSALKPLGQP